MTKRDELRRLVAALPDSEVDSVLADLRLRVTMAPTSDGLDDETRSWLDADLTPPLEPEDWSDVPKGKPIEWDEAQGAFVVVGGKD